MSSRRDPALSSAYYPLRQLSQMPRSHHRDFILHAYHFSPAVAASPRQELMSPQEIDATRQMRGSGGLHVRVDERAGIADQNRPSGDLATRPSGSRNAVLLPPQ